MPWCHRWYPKLSPALRRTVRSSKCQFCPRTAMLSAVNHNTFLAVQVFYGVDFAPGALQSALHNHKMVPRHTEGPERT